MRRESQMGCASLWQRVWTAVLWSIFGSMGLSRNLSEQQREDNVGVLPSVRRSPFDFPRVDERQQWYSWLPCRDDSLQHEVNKKWEAAKYFYDAYLPEDMFVRDILRVKMPRFDKLLLFCDCQQQQENSPRFPIQLLLHWNPMYPGVEPFDFGPSGNWGFI